MYLMLVTTRIVHPAPVLGAVWTAVRGPYGPSDAAALRVSTDSGEISGRVLEGVLFLPAYHDGGAVSRLLARDGASAPVRVKVAATA